MTINTENDEVEVYESGNGEYRWRRIDTTNGRIVSNGAEGYTDHGYAVTAARAYNPGCAIRDSSRS